MVNIRVADAVSAGMGLALGLAMTQYMFQVTRPTERIIKQVIVCLKCGSKNPVENRFCGQCGQALYPPPSVQCPKCGASMPSSVKFCGSCGSSIKE